MKKRLLIGILLCYTQLSAINLEVCAREPAICNDIQRNIDNLRRSDKKSRLRSIVQLSRIIGVLPTKDNKKVQKKLNEKVQQYSSIFGGKFFEVLAKKNCNGRIYFVEARFDNFYNVHFEEREPNQILIDNNIIKFDNEEYTMPQASIAKYKSSLQGIYVVPRVQSRMLENSNSTSVNNNQVCLNQKLNLRDINPNHHAIGTVDQNSIIINLNQKKTLNIWSKQHNINKPMQVMLVQSNNITGYISALPKFQKPCK